MEGDADGEEDGDGLVAWVAGGWGAGLPWWEVATAVTATAIAATAAAASAGASQRACRVPAGRWSRSSGAGSSSTTAPSNRLIEDSRSCQPSVPSGLSEPSSSDCCRRAASCSSRSAVTWSALASYAARSRVRSGGSSDVSQDRFELVHASAGVGLHRTARDAQRLGDLGFGQVRPVAQGEHLALAVRQLPDGGQHLLVFRGQQQFAVGGFGVSCLARLRCLRAVWRLRSTDRALLTTEVRR